MDYKKYSLENLENWLHDAMSSGEATPKEIYDTICNVVSENYYIYQRHADRAYELMTLLNGNNLVAKKSESLQCDKDDPSPECKKSWSNFWEDYMPPWGHSDLEYLCKKDKVTKWLLPVQQSVIDGVDDYYVNFPDDLLEAADLKEGDQVEWVDQGDGSYLLRKVTQTLKQDEC